MTAPRERLYDRRRWRRRAALQMKIDKGLCQMCLKQGRTEPAVHVHHLTPHAGDETIFWTSELTSVCRRHHNELHGRASRPEIGEDGWPIIGGGGQGKSFDGGG